MKKLMLIFSLSMALATTARSLDISKFEELPEDLKAFYLLGVANGILASSGVNEHILGQTKDFYCMPTNIKFGSDLAKVAMDNFRNENKADTDAALAVLFGLQMLFPCE